jgi:hypothetical protein
MGTPAQFRDKLMGYCDKLEVFLTVLPQIVASDVRYRVALTTPILSGRASGSWNANPVTIDRTVQPEGYNNPAGAPLDGNDFTRLGKLGDTYHVSNVIDYIKALNDGSSAKAPAGFVEMQATETEVLMPDYVAKAKVQAGFR